MSRAFACGAGNLHILIDYDTVDADAIEPTLDATCLPFKIDVRPFQVILSALVFPPA